MKRTILGLIALALVGCGDDRGACLYDVYDGLVCYENATASCCQQILGEFHSGESCSKYGGRVEPASYAGCH